VTVAGPADKGFNVEWSVVKECEELMVFFFLEYHIRCSLLEWNIV